MAVSAHAYAKLTTALKDKTVDLDSDALKVMLTTSSYTPNQATHGFKSDVTNEVASGAGYTTGGAALTSVTWNLTSLTGTLDAADVVWTVPDGSSLAAAYAVIYDSTPASDATRPLVGYVDFGGTVTVAPTGTSGTLSLVWNASGILTITVA